MKKLRVWVVAMCMSLCMTACAGAGQTTTQGETQENAGEDKVAGADEMLTPETVVEEGMTPVYADSLQDGTYDIEVKSSSSMFKIISCQLMVSAGKMTAAMTMSGTGYLYVYMGTGAQAAAASVSDAIAYQVNKEGQHVYKVPVEALNQGIACAAYSKNREKWYDRTLVFDASSLPLAAWKENPIKQVELEEGSYTVAVTLQGGSGKSTISSPAKLTVTSEGITASITWSSPNYDYMIVDGKKYLPVSQEGNAVFEILVQGFDYPLPVLADTTAMSTPHEIAYTLYFDSATIQKEE